MVKQLFKVGDVVTLKTNSTKLLINRVEELLDYGTIVSYNCYCHWIDNNKTPHFVMYDQRLLKSLDQDKV